MPPGSPRLGPGWRARGGNRKETGRGSVRAAGRSTSGRTCGEPTATVWVGSDHQASHTSAPMTRVSHHRPSMAADAFNCPNCGVYAEQSRWPARIDYTLRTNIGGDPAGMALPGWSFVLCGHCGEASVWLYDRMIYPDVDGGPAPNPDLPEGIRRDYVEAQSIIGRSPRGAAALLRLCIQKLCRHLGEKGKDLNTDIASLVKKGLPPAVQQALDAVRVIGNEGCAPRPDGPEG
jgi:hypothetical protein